MRKYIALLAILAFALTCAGDLIAAQISTSSATIIKIEGNKIILRNARGEISTIKNDPTGLRPGQTVRLQNGKIVNSTSNPPSVQPQKPGGLNPGNPIGINPQPEPPGKNL